MIRALEFLRVMSLVLGVLSIYMIREYLIERDLIRRWNLMDSMSAMTTLKLYIKHTKEKHGHIGIWLKTLIGSFAGFCLVSVLLAYI